MKFTATFLALLGATVASATTVTEVDTQECADQGGLFDVSTLPEGVTEHRKCAGHPLGNPDQLTAIANVHKRDCAWNPYGCESGYCWKQCEFEDLDGSWCWQALAFGRGDWVTCKKNSDCEPAKLPKADCGICNKPECGCGC